jgi:regulator of protease activity HflC (stomatin/prohibitin superfamily)
MYDMSADITFGPIKMFTVNTGEVRVCYDQGRVVIWTEGIYAVNSNTFIVKGKLTTQQQNVRFSRHRVLLDGGISMLVEGLLTYKIIDVQKLMEEIGDTALLRAIQDVTKAELSRVFANVHLEELSNRNAQSHEPGSTSGADAKKALLGDAPQTVDDREEHTFTRSGICHEVVGHVQPFASKWGVQIVNFQLESTTLADERYGREVSVVCSIV